MTPAHDPAWLADLRQRLETQRDELAAAIAAARRVDHGVSPDKAIGRLTRQDALQQQQMAMALLRRQEQDLARVQKALLAIAEGQYGRCQRCGEAIAPARLQAMPNAVLCVPCASRPPVGR